MNSYIVIIFFALLIIISYLFNIVARKTNIPSVLLLIATGLLLQPLLHKTGQGEIDFFSILEVLGHVGLIMIVLEAALELELTKAKLPLIFKSLLVAFLCLVGTSFGVAYIFVLFFDTDLFHALLYAIPIGTMSSAIVLPSVENLDEHNKEFMIYESTFSDILGIMFFYFLLGTAHGGEHGASHSAGDIFFNVSGNILLTIIASVALSLLLVFVFQNIRSKVKLFLLIAVLLLFYSIGKLLHISSLLIILVFGLTLQNHRFLLKGGLQKIFKKGTMEVMLKDLQLVTFEFSFVVRTFFFVIFGITITIASIFSGKVLLVSMVTILAIYLIRLIFLFPFKRKSLFPALFIAPRGLITILLFFAIPEDYHIEDFDPGILLFIILVSSITMAITLMRNSRKKKQAIEAVEKEENVVHKLYDEEEEEVVKPEERPDIIDMDTEPREKYDSPEDGNKGETPSAKNEDWWFTP